MAEDSKRADEPLTDEATRLKKRARRRLIGAAALALLAAIILPMVMDHQPAPTLKDIQVRIPSPDEPAVRKSAPKPEPIHEPESRPDAKSDTKSDAKPAPVPEQKSEPKPESKPEPKPESKPEPKPESKPEPKPEPKADKGAEDAGTGSWEVQLGAYAEAGRVRILSAKIKELGLPVFTAKVDTPNGERIRVRSGPFSSQEAAEKARTRIKIIGVDGVVAKSKS